MIDGNFSVKDAASKCLAIIFKYQHHVPARDDLLEFIMKKLAISKNFSHRRAFIWFCKHLVSIIPFQMFRDIFSETLLSMSNDPIPRIRQDLCLALIVIKPFFDRTEEEAYIITEML